MSNRLRIGITQGDTNGIGWECILKMFADPRTAELFTPVIYGSKNAAEFYKKNIEESENINFSIIESADAAQPKRLNLIDTGDVQVEVGKATPESGTAALKALRAAVADAKRGAIDAIVTAPICKENTKSDEFPYAGHTEYLGNEFGATPTMMMVSDVMRVALVTTHIALEEVKRNITAENIITKLTALRKTLIADFGLVEPRIAVLALNPHAGENGVIGSEEIQIIKPAVRTAIEAGVYAFGPMAADGFFLAGQFEKYDAVLAMYHDQGLAPFKALTPYGVNYTAGLSVVRTSPDHGVAYDIAGQGKADPQAMREAVYAAIDILRNRRAYAEMSRNPLPHYEREKGRDVSISELKLPETEETD